MIDQLRDRARALGIDPEPFGDDANALLSAIEAAQAPKMVRTATAIAVKPLTVSLDGDIEGWPPPR